ncbi:hypothetical protein [Helicobacter cetorum]|uniref:Uncharacterized protein n=1 Tax=Helicobacter cetorum (strain ATCC BAA-540 / CCUG 52418 / MIT 99-5656) TaxID=1163745 RepID=I0EQI3_HELCM|nr:hypothetical protein [Helicobacter cetorum]AFI05202.1 hypothetical protein HCD_00850 [Helicobacter cetorum MIT 99-5656]
MACKFCPKVRKTDWIFIFIAAVAFYIASKLEDTSPKKTSLAIHNETDKERKERFEALQRACLLNKDKRACEKVFSH